MADPKDSPLQSHQTPLNQGTSEPGFARVGPILDVERFRQEYLFGVPMRAALTGEEISSETLKNFIRKGISDFETSVRIPVHPVQAEDMFDFERSDDLNFGTRRLTRWPLLDVSNLAALWPGRMEGQETDYPTSWVTKNDDTGLIRVVPNSGSMINADAGFINSTGYKAIVLGQMKAWPNMWRIRYRAGFDFDKIPDVVNDLIGTLAAIKFLSQMGPAIFPFNSFSVGVDGLSQGTSNAGPQWLAQRIADLTGERDRLVGQLKSHFGTDIMFAAW